jgi:hypothetical protein
LKPETAWFELGSTLESSIEGETGFKVCFHKCNVYRYSKLATRSGIAPAPAPASSPDTIPTAASASSPKGGHPFACGVPDGPKSDPFRMAERAEQALAGVPGQPGQPGQGQPLWVGSLVMVPPIYSKVDEPEAGCFGGSGIGGGGGGGGGGGRGGLAGGGGGRRGGVSDDVDFTERSIPPWLGQSTHNLAPGCPPEAFAALKKKLAARPVWARLALLEAGAVQVEFSVPIA